MELGKAGTETVVVHSVERDVELPVEPEEAWEAVSDPERLGHWLGGDVEMDPVPGGEFHIRFDGEDGGERPCADWLLGSRAYAESLTALDVTRTKAMVLVDLVSDPGLVLPREYLSATGAGLPVQDRIYSIGGALGYARVFTNDTAHGYAITDDHVPFRERGIPSVDLIHLVAAPQYFPEWHHTQHDDMAHVSAASLEAVGRTLEAWLEQGAPTT